MFKHTFLVKPPYFNLFKHLSYKNKFRFLMRLISYSCLILWDPMDCCLSSSSVHGGSPGKTTRSGLFCLLWEDLPNLGMEVRLVALQPDSLPWRKHKNTGVGSLSLLQRIFPAWETNWGLLHCSGFFIGWTTGMLWFMGLQRIGQDWVTELKWTELNQGSSGFC